MQSRLEALSVFGRPPGGTFQDGVSRVGYSDADLAGRKFVIGLMREAGAQVRIDAAGNIFAGRPGKDPSLPPLLFGSHIDSVPNGGNFDGTLGSLASIEILRTLHDQKIETRRPLTAVVWACEEASFAGASLNGSRIAAGTHRPEELNLVSRGLTKAEAIRRVGGDPARLESALVAKGAYHAYLELHIEQGGTLARDGVPIGVVNGIVAIDDYDVVIQGVPNHAGTTPMPDRRDAMIAAAALTLAVRETVTAEPGAQVGTVGHLEVIPNAVNVVPGEVRMSIEFRDLSSAKLDRLGQTIRARAAAIAAETRTTIQVTRALRHEAALAAPEIQRVIEAAASRLRLDARRLPSGAGHDAQMMATRMPMGMIFVPSVGGVSHSPKELTAWQDCANGATMLLETVLDLAA
ncbi:MAG TPA: Zn-dependent hydrolase [Solibacterales bacterium]|nr:Zn-dependent hydrolase [Bryobacterales bacterium]